ncbi:Prefoldin alpha subunit [Trichoderma cornu-damae]|uniref:Prefoldin alpha subunit n=1 Tax=Trichoderma cornu-damae TaxID=654480 RepID=A0A9P8QRA7_9HYPO|nr:Prefoldin alpha subunit [Trichoderma cornu-damae]
MSSDQKETINLDSLEPQQLAQVKKQLEEELEHLTASFAKLHGAQTKFKECLRCVQSRAADSKGSKSVLVPLTNSLYVSGELATTDTVLVDVGTGFLIEKKFKSAEKFYDSKVKEVGDNLKDLEGIIQRKQINVRAIEEGTSTSYLTGNTYRHSLMGTNLGNLTVLRQKILAAQSEG